MRHDPEYRKLAEAGIDYTLKSVMGNGFWGTEFSFKTIEDAEFAIRLLRLNGGIQNTTNGYGFTLY